MVAPTGCGHTRNIGSPEIVGIEDAFTGKGLNPDADPTGLNLILSLIDGAYWPIHVCGDTGVGAPFSENPVGVNKGGNVLTRFEPIGETVTAHGCLMNCHYNITVSLAAEVIVAEIDGVYNILRVRHTSSTVPTLGSSNDCRCCGMTAQRSVLYYRIISVDPPGCGDIRACDEYVIHPSDNCLPTARNPLSIVVGCLANAGSEFQDQEDWTINVCGVEATIESLNCTASVPTCVPTPTVTEYSEICNCTEPMGEEYGETRLEIYITATCNGCDYRILIYSKPDSPEPCSLEDVPIRTVEMEACGLPNLRVDDRVIVAEMPTDEVDPYTGCPLIKYFLIRACTTDDCADPCDPPPPPTTCCGILCEDLPASLTATIEIMDCDCTCGGSVTLTKMPCNPGNEGGDWRYEATPAFKLCDLPLAFFELSSIRLMCGEPPYEGGVGFSMVANGTDGELVDNICEPGAFYFVFEFANLPICKDKMPGRYPADLSCRARITITE